jgi:glyoxylase-like metal-dependent hydrolase (beta-lactamase superfamily II)
MRDDLRGLPALNAAQKSLIHITIPVGMLQCNCSIIGDPLTREALVVDPGDEVTRILELLGRRRLTVKAIVSTHAHIDHVGGLSKLHQYTGAPVLMHRDDLPLYQAMEMQASFLGVLPPDLTEVDQLLKEGDILRWGSLEAQVIHTPGHTPGSVSLYLPHDAGKISLTDRGAKSAPVANADAGNGPPRAGVSDASGESDSQSQTGFSEMGDSQKPEIHVPQLLAGDTLFAGSIGRTDLWGGSLEEIMDSLRGKLMQLPDATIVHPGHGPMTTIGRERETNPFLQPE